MCGLMLTWRKSIGLSKDAFSCGDFLDEAGTRHFASVSLLGISEKMESNNLLSGGIKFLPAKNSPTGKAVLLVANEVIGKAEIYDVE